MKGENMNFKIISKIFFTLLIAIFPLNIFCNDYCLKMKTDYSNLINNMKKPISLEAVEKNPTNFDIVSKLYDEYKLNDPFEHLKGYTGKNIATLMIKAKLYIYNEDYQSGIDILEEILADYPKHADAIYWKTKASDLLSISNQTNKNDESNFEKAIIFRDLGFPDKSLDILKKIVEKDSSDKVWYEIAETVLFHRLIMATLKYPYKDDIIEKTINTKFRPMSKISRVKSKGSLPENDCMIYSMDICEYLAFNSKNMDMFLSENSYQKNYNDSSKTLKGQKPSKETIKMESSEIMSRLNIKLIGYYQEYWDTKNIRELVSSIYVMKKDLGVKFYDIFMMAKNCDLDQIIESANEKSFAKSLKNKITEDKITINMTDYFVLCQQNYLDIENWKGPYRTIPKDNSYGYDYVFHENKAKMQFGVLSAGFDYKIDDLDSIKDDDKGLFIFSDDLN
jgi:tetratricopeptide (TPR) repeat protein